MSDETPYPSDQTGDPAFEEFVALVCKRPGMYVAGVRTLDGVCHYLQGFDDARSGGPLQGFHQWLIVNGMSSHELHWIGAVRKALGDIEEGNPRIAAFGELLGRFFRDRREGGITKIYYDYAQLL